MWLIYCVQHTLAGELSPSQRDCELPPSLRHHTFGGCRDHFSELREKKRKPTQTSSYTNGDGDRGYDFWINNYSWSLLRFSYKKKTHTVGKDVNKNSRLYC